MKTKAKSPIFIFLNIQFHKNQQEGLGVVGTPHKCFLSENTAQTRLFFPISSASLFQENIQYYPLVSEVSLCIPMS